MKNSKLFQLYQDHWHRLHSELMRIEDDSDCKVKAANPLLLKLKDDKIYSDADLKVMFFGQEPNTWGGHLRDNVSEVQLIYEDFFLSEYCYNVYRRPFWNGVNQLRNLFGRKYPKTKIKFYWNDVIKIGKFNGSGMPPKYIQDVELENFKILTDEISILEPDILIFLSGPNYDWFIEQQFGDITFKAVNGYTKRQMAKLEIPKVKSAIRTYHPGYLKRSRNTDDFLKSIVKEL